MFLAEVIDSKNLCTVYISRRIRAHRTFHLLFDHLEKLPRHVITEAVREWDYGEYEGLLSSEIQARNPGWVIWKDGCPGGESTEEMCFRVDQVIEQVSWHIFRRSVLHLNIMFTRCGKIIGNGWNVERAPGTLLLSLMVTSIASSSLAGFASPFPWVCSFRSCCNMRFTNCPQAPISMWSLQEYVKIRLCPVMVTNLSLLCPDCHPFIQPS